MFGDNRDKIVINENAYFYKKKESKKIAKAKITEAFKAVSTKKLNNFLLKEESKSITIKGKKITYSICVFKEARKPTFISEHIDKWLEIRMSYLLIIELAEYVVISKKNISKLNDFLKLLDPIDYSTLSSLFINSKTSFESLSLQNTNISDSALRSKNVASNNLQDSLSTLGASSYVIQNLRLNDEKERVTLSLNTSRINKMGLKKGLKVLFEWCIILCDKIEKHKPIESFLSVFAAPIDFQKESASLKPIAILLDINHLLNSINSGIISRSYIQIDGEERNIDLNIFATNFNRLKQVKFDAGSDSYYIDNTTADDLEIKINKNSITLQSSKLKNIILEYDGGSTKSILSYINERNDFIINFEDIEMIYTKRKLFKDHRLLNNIPNFIKIFETHDELNNTTSEKGKPKATSRKFEKKSVFDVVETKYKDKFEYFICDDMGNEWADHIGVTEDLVALYHSKSKSALFSASAFHDVIGQAQKNYGILTPNAEQLAKKKTTWEKFYKSSTKIKMLRKGSSVDDAIKLWKENIGSPNFKRQVNIVVDFISKSALEDRLDKLKNGVSFSEKNQVIQILWFISSLINASQELGIESKVICKP